MGTKEFNGFDPDQKILCESCGEEYSVTYKNKKCPFCGAKPGKPGKAGGAAGGRRLSKENEGRDSALTQILNRIEPVRAIGLVLSLILIAAAIYIVITVLSPLFHKGPAPAASSGGQASASVSASASAAASASASASASVSPAASVSAPAASGAVSTGAASAQDPGQVLAPLVHATAIRIDAADVTLKPGESFTPKVTLTPAECDDEIVWTSSNEAAATVSGGGTVTNVNTGSSIVAVTITATAGSVSAECVVRCRPGASAPASTPAPSTPDTPAAPSKPTTSTAVNKAGTVTGTSTGLWVRPGPGKDNQPQDTLENGTVVTILEETDNGWYKISYSGAGGKTTTGYASKDYIQVK